MYIVFPPDLLDAIGDHYKQVWSGITWDTYQIKDILNLEKVQRKAARFVKQDYSNYNSLTRMILKSYRIDEKT